MNKRVFIIHGWDGYPDEGWFPLLKKDLEQKGFQVIIPSMPDPANPKIDSWVPYLTKIVDMVDENTFFVGHSIGCQTILRFLEKLSPGKKIGGAIFVAGWFTLKNLETDEEKNIAKPWLETPIDLEKVKFHTNKFITIFSDDDPVVPISNKELFEKHLGAKTIVEHNKGHFGDDSGIKELPIVLDAILSF